MKSAPDIQPSCARGLSKVQSRRRYGPSRPAIGGEMTSGVSVTLLWHCTALNIMYRGHKTITVRKSVAVWVLFGVLATWGCQSREEHKQQGPPLKISLALAPFPYSGLIAIADDKGFFKESGLEVSIKEYPSGFCHLEALSRGEAQMAMANDFVFVAKMNDDPSLRVVASIRPSKYQ